ncbi:alanine--tRNA ligase-related protein [Candidatus Shikimatogenerans silvanidophilus]|uniref:alanine--tRNA ligase-related protein n=1 Tax=Candidatus Shikimatogenerans silvanidophilus TaxID=2782547 RepID=UPI001BAD0576|nr:alanine--tRNA ligase-related protein [Candidatus Shikimatogenerans silvanidophilus]
MKSSLIKEIFLDFFKKKNHKILPSFPIILSNDPSLFFTNSGMNYFKDFFLGYKKPKYTRIANSQKCLRISGKHNDLETVGYDDYHHTMFEMLGNWSFGDYYKYDIISWAWDLLINKYNLSKKDIYITIFSGNIKKNIKKDNTSYKIWNNFVNKERILFFNKENFWNMGEEGLCGTSTEIHIDLRSEKEKREFPGKYLINKGNNNIIEIWNIVFIEFFKIKKHLKKLSKKYIDTGMGLERISRILQKKKSNYETDLFFPIIKQIENVFKIKYGKNLNKDVAIRIISDHIRSISFSISDGVIPSNNGHEYVIRRLIRRTISYSYRFLKKKKPIIYKIVDSLSEITKKNFPEINNNKDFIKEIIEKEEFLFLTF